MFPLLLLPPCPCRCCSPSYPRRCCSQTIPLELVERVKGLIVHEAMEQAGLAAKGQDVDIDNETEWTGSAYIHSILYRDPAFEEVLAAPKPMALIHLLLGKSALMASWGCHVKGPGFTTGEGEVALHSDDGNGMIPPFRTFSELSLIHI